MSRIANVGFDRANPFRAIVVTPSAGVYYGDLSLTAIDRILGLKCKEPTWLTLQGTSENWGYPSTGVLLDGTAYLGTEGNGIFQINSPSAGLEATYFDLAQTFGPGSAVATLKTSRAVVAWARYSLRVIADIDNANRRHAHPDEPQTLRRTDTASGRADEKGIIAMPKDPIVEDMFSSGTPLACELDFIGDGQHAPAHLRFQCAP